MTRYLPLIVLGVMLNAAAQLALKQGMRNIGYFDFRLESCSRVVIAVVASPYILAGLGCYIFSVAVWLLVLSRVEVSFAYPLLSIGYIVTAVAGRLFFNESMDITRWAGIMVICLGVWLITRTG
ncbi:MAG: 4-amino-4-deoxy-L-arabinose transferase [Desulfobacterales bacterium S5133MH16]|nr:MAG: 4-amino-4-deoxy-L-arabinose transferase [Desulfobacterales bacterium S5133MH16]